MERKIGEIFEYNGEWYQCMKEDMYDYCKGCASFENLRCTTLYGNRDCWLKATCKKLEKVGEPYMLEAKKFQKYRVFHTPYIYNKIDYSWQSFADPYYISLEIKQNKEDMEEKYSELTDIVHEYMDKDMTYKDFKEAINDWVDDYVANKESDKPTLKPFDIEAAKSGKPVCTRDGRKARIVCFDAKGDQPIIALVEAKGNKDALIEKVERYFINGHSVFEVRETNNDLMMLPEKKEGWINICRNLNTNKTEYKQNRIRH